MNRHSALKTMLRLRRMVPAALAALAVGTVGFASSAGAAPGSALTRPAAHPNVAASNYLAGYQVTPSGGLASASVTFTVPSATCTATDEADNAIMWDGVYTDSLNTYALVASECISSGPETLYVFRTPAGTFTEPGPAPGDAIVTSLFQSGSATWAEIHDLTSGAYWVANDSTDVGDTVVDIGSYTEVASTGRPVPTFTAVHFSNATVNGDYLGFSSVGATQYKAMNGADLLIKTTTLTTTGTGTTFKIKFKNAS